MTVPHKKNQKRLLENKSPLTCTMKGKSTLPKIASPAIMEECEVIDEHPDDTSPVVMEDRVNGEHKDSTRKDFIREK